MIDKDFAILENFIKENIRLFKTFEAKETNVKYSLIDKVLRCAYFERRK